MIRIKTAATVLCYTTTAFSQTFVGGVEYQKLATRGETEQRMFNLIQDLPDLQWYQWRRVASFPGAESGMLDAKHDPENELDRMEANGPGPDLTKTFRDKNGRSVSWTRVDGATTDRRVPFNVFDDDGDNEFATGYLYTTVTAERPIAINVTMGSDDGLRFWLNGEMLIDADVARGLNPTAHALTLDLEQGVNHLFCKVTQGTGGWEYQINVRQALDPVTDARLQFLLDRDFPTPEQKYYADLTIPVPYDVVLEVGGLDVLPDGRVVACSRRGDVYLIEPRGDGGEIEADFTLFASGLHEPLGVEVGSRDGLPAVFVTQRGELTALIDTDGDDQADVYETVCDAWGVSGGYHEFAFGPKFDADGNAWVTLNVDFCGGIGKSIVPFRGWAVKITPDGEMLPVCGGLRSPNGIAVLPNGDAFYVDNQGDFVGTNKLAHLAPGSWHGHPSGLRWTDDWEEGDEEPERMRPAIWFPYSKMGQSSADIVIDDTGGAFGPFAGQFFVGDQFSAEVLRVFLENIDGIYQGACFPFRKGLDCGVNRIAFDDLGRMYVGQTDRGWTSEGRRRFGVERIEWTGANPFEVLTVQAAPDGFVLTFTAPAGDEAMAPESYRIDSHTYRYHSNYGSPEVEREAHDVIDIRRISQRSVHLVLDGLRSGGEGFVYNFDMAGVRDAAGGPLLHAKAYYTMQVLPKRMPPLDGRQRSMR